MLEFNHILTIAEGLHARPAGHFVKKTQGYAEKITLSKNGQKVDAKKLFSVLKLQAKNGDEITVSVEGSNENQVIDELKNYCNSEL